MKSVSSTWMLFAVTQVLGAWLVSAHAESPNTATLLQTELHQQYPEVESWIVAPVHVTRAKRTLRLFVQSTTDTIIYRDANLFVVRSGAAAAQHYVVRANQRVLTATAFTRKGSSLQLAKTSYALRDVFASSCPSIAAELRTESSLVWRLRR